MAWYLRKLTELSSIVKFSYSYLGSSGTTGIVYSSFHRIFSFIQVHQHDYQQMEVDAANIDISIEESLDDFQLTSNAHTSTSSRGRKRRKRVNQDTVYFQ